MPTDRFSKDLIASGVLLLCIFPLGMLGVLSPWVLWPIFVIHVLLLLSANVFAIKEMLTDCGHKNWLAVLMLTFVLTFSILGCLLPVTARDALIHHLAVPTWWLADGRIHTFAWHEWSFYPMLIQLAFVPLLQFFPPQSCALYQLLYLIPLAGSARLIAMHITTKHLPRVLAFFIVLTLPITLRLGSEPLVDLALGAFCGVSIALLLQRNLLGAVAMGLALGIKYNALPFVAFALLLAPLAKIPLNFLIRFALVVSLVAAPWYVRNYVDSGNPVYPLGASSKDSGSLNSIESRTLLYGESIGELILTPVSMTIFGQDEDPRRFDGVLSPILLLSVFGLWKWRNNRSVQVLALLAGAYFIFAQLNSGARVRYLLPIVPSVGAITGIAVAELSPLLIAFCVIGHLAFVGRYVSLRLTQLHTLSFLNSSQTTENYLTRALPEYHFVHSIAEHIENHAKVYLVLTGNRFYYYPFETRSAGYHSGSELERWANLGTVKAELVNRGCNYLLVNTRLFEKMTNRALLDSLASQLKLVAFEGEFALYRTQ